MRKNIHFDFWGCSSKKVHFSVKPCAFFFLFRREKTLHSYRFFTALLHYGFFSPPRQSIITDFILDFFINRRAKGLRVCVVWMSTCVCPFFNNVLSICSLGMAISLSPPPTKTHNADPKGERISHQLVARRSPPASSQSMQ